MARGIRTEDLVSGLKVPALTARYLRRLPIYTGTLASTPTAANITAAVGMTPSTAGEGFNCLVSEANLTEPYWVISNGTSWLYVALTAAS